MPQLNAPKKSDEVSLARTAWSGALTLMAAFGLSGALNYFFQTLAASRLSSVDYGLLNVWLARVSFALVVATGAQFVPNLRPFSIRQMRLVSWLSVIASGAALSSMFILDYGPWRLAIEASLLGILYYFMVGHLQSTHRFVLMSTATILLPAIKIGAALAPSPHPGLDQMMWAYTFSVVACTLLISLCLIFTRQTIGQKPALNANAATTLACSLILAGALALAPQMDLLNLNATQTAEALGRFAQAALPGKAIFFAAAALLQVALPYHVSGEHSLKRLEQLGIAACILASILAAVLGPYISKRWLGFDLSDRRIWVLLNGLGLTALYGIMQQIQIACARNLWKKSLSLLVALLAGMFALREITGALLHASISFYLAAALVWYLALSLLAVRRSA